MKKTFLHRLLFTVLGTILVWPLAQARAVTLDEVLQDVVRTNPQILEKQKAYNAAVSDQKDARSGYFPKIIFTGDLGYKRWRDSDTRYDYDNDGYYSARLTLSQMLFDGGKTSAYEKARQSYMLSSLYDYMGTASQVAYDTISAYFNVLKYEELQKLAMTNVLTHQSLLENIRLQVEKGKKGRSELERVNGRLATAQSRLLLRQNDYKKAVYNLHKMLGRFVNVEEMAVPAIDDSQLPSSLKEALDLQVKNNPMLREAFYNISQKEYEHQGKKSEYYGRLSLEASASIENEFDPSDEYEVDARVGVRYQNTLYDAGRSHRVQAAVSQIHEEQQKRYRVQRTLLNDIQLCWAAHKLLAEQIGVLKKNQYFAGRTLQSYKEEFLVGRRNLINILDAQNEYQYVSEQLANAMFDMEMEKYKVLHSEGVLLERLGLLNAQAVEMLKKDDVYKPLAADSLPLSLDFDGDSVVDDLDVSLNSLKDTPVSELGINKKYDTRYIYETAEKDTEARENVVGEKDSLKEKPIHLNVSTRFDFNAFLPGTVGLSKVLANDMMKDMVKQARAYSLQTPLFITVSTNEYNDDNANYNLALKRAYTLKRILQNHQIEDKGVFVFADTNAPKGRNILRLKFASKIGDYRKQYRVRTLNARVFMEEDSRIENMTELNFVINDIKNSEGRAEIVLYANELENKDENQRLGQRRVKVLEEYLAGKGIGPDKVTVFSWGGFRQDPLQPESRKLSQFLQYVVRN